MVVQGAIEAGSYIYLPHTLHTLEDASNRLAHNLLRLGIGPGVRTVLMVTPGFDFFALTFALFKTGAIPILIDPGMGVKSLKTCIAEAEPTAFIGIPKAHLARMILGWGKKTIRIRVVAGFWLPGFGIPLKSFRRDIDAPFVPVHAEPDDMAAILFTSGSTGPPKGAVYTHGIFEAQIESLRQDYGVKPGELDLATFPLFALFGPALGMAAVIPDMDATRPAQADPRGIIDAITTFKTTNMFASPALIERVGRFGEANDVRLPTLKRVVSSGAPATPASLARFATMLESDAQILPSYGATEALPVAFISHHEQIRETARLTAEGAGVCVGRPVRGIEVSIMKITDAAVPEYTADWRQPSGEAGEIVVCGPVVTPMYYNRPESTVLAKMWDAEGRLYHRMGDIGYLDAEGKLWMCGRKSHRVETSEGILFSVACERVFNEHPAVQRTALVGVLRAGETVPVLCVEKRRDARMDNETVREELLEIGAANPRTKAIRTILFHPAFPVDIRHNAKIFREKLAEWATERLP